RLRCGACRAHSRRPVARHTGSRSYVRGRRQGLQTRRTRIPAAKTVMLERTPKTETFTGAAGNKLVADRYGDGERPAMLLHGGGQTRHAFAGTAEALAKSGWTAFTVDQRGHGDSEWIADGSYRVFDFADDAAKVAAAITERFS